MDYNKFKTFIEVVDSGSFTEAAKTMLRSQQAVSQQIQILEEELNTKLFDRLGPKAQLTKDGEILYQKIRPFFVSIENACQTFTNTKTVFSGTIRIGVWMEQGVSYIPSVLAQFKKKFPNTIFKLEIGTDPRLKSLLNENRIDFAFLLESGKNSILKSTPVYKRNLILVASQKYLNLCGKITTFKDTLQLDLIDYPTHYSAYNVWVKQNAREILSLAKKKFPIITVANDLISKELVVKNLGMAVLPKDIVEKEIRSQKIMPILSQQALPVKVEIDFTYKRRQVFSVIEQEFIKYVIGHPSGI